MNTIILEHIDSNTITLLKALFEKIGLSATTEIEESTGGTITNPEIIKSIRAYEEGKEKGKVFMLPELKSSFDKMIADAEHRNTTIGVATF